MTVPAEKPINRKNRGWIHLHLTSKSCHHRVVSKIKHSKTKTEARSTQISKTKHPKLENEAPYLENEDP